MYVVVSMVRGAGSLVPMEIDILESSESHQIELNYVPIFHGGIKIKLKENPNLFPLHIQH
jgi:hypothetical protein